MCYAITRGSRNLAAFLFFSLPMSSLTSEFSEFTKSMGIILVSTSPAMSRCSLKIFKFHFFSSSNCKNRSFFISSFHMSSILLTYWLYKFFQNSNIFSFDVSVSNDFPFLSYTMFFITDFSFPLNLLIFSHKSFPLLFLSFISFVIFTSSRKLKRKQVFLFTENLRQK